MPMKLPLLRGLIEVILKAGEFQCTIINDKKKRTGNITVGAVSSHAFNVVCAIIHKL